MNAHRVRAAEQLAARLPVSYYRRPRHVMPWAAVIVLQHTADGCYTRVTASGFTQAHAIHRARREVLRELLHGWWG